MIDAQSSALAAQIDSGSATVPVAIIGVSPVISGMCPARTPDTARETHALPIYSPHSVFMPVLTDFAIFAPACRACPRHLNPCHWSHLRLNPTVKTDVQDSQKCKNHSSQNHLVLNHLKILLKVNKAKRHEKNSEFFSGCFYGKSLGIHAKIVQKNAQICAKKWRFLTQKNH